LVFLKQSFYGFVIIGALGKYYEIRRLWLPPKFQIPFQVLHFAVNLYWIECMVSPETEVRCLSILHWDSNPRPLEHEHPTITTRPGLRSDF